MDLIEGEVEVKSSSTSPGTWGAFNSMLSPSGSKTNIALVPPPLIRLPPTQYDITQNAVKLSAVFHEHGNPFESADEDEIYNLLTKEVMNETKYPGYPSA